MVIETVGIVVGAWLVIALVFGVVAGTYIDIMGK